MSRRGNYGIIQVEGNIHHPTAMKNLSTQQTFDSIQKLDQDGNEFWSARELMYALGYLKWRNFIEVIAKAIESCKNAGVAAQEHFADVGKPIKGGNGAIQYIKDYNLSRYACYLIAQNGDPRKKEIANAQTYFAIQTRRQEVRDINEQNRKRVLTRSQMKIAVKILKDTAKKAGVTHFGTFMDEGYMGLYGGLRMKELKEKKKVEGNYFDYAGIAEMAANLFRTTQTDAKLKKENILGEEISKQVHYKVGREVRNAIEKIGGIMPEDLPPEKDIKEIEKEVKKNDVIKAKGVPILPL